MRMRHAIELALWVAGSLAFVALVSFGARALLAVLMAGQREPSLKVVWGFSGFTAIVAYFAARWSVWLGLYMIPLLAMTVMDMVRWLADPICRPIVLSDRGPNYIVQCYASLVFIFIALIAGLIHGHVLRGRIQDTPPFNLGRSAPN